MWKEHLERQQVLKQKMLEKLETDAKRLNSVGKKLDGLIDTTLDRLKEQIENKNISAYKSAVAVHKMIDGITKLNKQSMDLYDRINGILIETPDDAVEDTVVDAEDVKELEAVRSVRKDAEKLILLLVKSDNTKPHPDDLNKEQAS
jgi:hypothetical protein